MKSKIQTVTVPINVKPIFDKTYIDNLFQEGFKYHKQGNLDAAEKVYLHVLNFNQNHSDSLHLLGVINYQRKNYEKALGLINQSIKFNLKNSASFSNRGSVLKELKRFDESLESYSNALRINPHYAKAFFNKSICSLLLGDFEYGLHYYEWRWETNDFTSHKRNFSQPIWLGDKNIQNKIVLIHSEQGLGDTIQFCRYLTVLKSFGAKVIFEVESNLIKLLEPSFRDACQFIPKGSTLPYFDYHCPLLSLPFAFKTNLSNIPSNSNYLQVNTEHVKFWNSKIGYCKFKIGIAWQGSQSKIDVGRSFPLSLFHILSIVKNVRLISLQKGFGTEQLEILPKGMKVETLGGDFDNGPDAFIDTAAVMKCLDLVITSDTSIAHLAGALGVQVWVALQFVPDWRWLLDRIDSPWYPSMRLFRQKERDIWTPVFEDIKDELLKLNGHE